MNIFEWYWIRKNATDHPFFDAHPRMLSRREADTAVKESVKVTGKEFMDSIRRQVENETIQNR